MTSMAYTEATVTPYGEMKEEVTTTYRDITEAESSGSKFQTTDWVVFSLMLVVSVAIGVISAIRSRRNNNTQEYLLGGRNMPPVPVAISLLGGVISAISILGKT